MSELFRPLPLPINPLEIQANWMDYISEHTDPSEDALFWMLTQLWQAKTNTTGSEAAPGRLGILRQENIHPRLLIVSFFPFSFHTYLAAQQQVEFVSVWRKIISPDAPFRAIRVLARQPKSGVLDFDESDVLSREDLPIEHRLPFAKRIIDSFSYLNGR